MDGNGNKGRKEQCKSSKEQGRMKKEQGRSDMKNVALFPRPDCRSKEISATVCGKNVQKHYQNGRILTLIKLLITYFTYYEAKINHYLEI